MLHKVQDWRAGRRFERDPPAYAAASLKKDRFWVGNQVTAAARKVDAGPQEPMCTRRHLTVKTDRIVVLGPTFEAHEQSKFHCICAWTKPGISVVRQSDVPLAPSSREGRFPTVTRSTDWDPVEPLVLLKKYGL